VEPDTGLAFLRRTNDCCASAASNEVGFFPRTLYCLNGIKSVNLYLMQSLRAMQLEHAKVKFRG
jgi:hypothetical protein